MPKILIYPQKILRQSAEPVTDFGRPLQKLIEALKTSLIPQPKNPQGVGLAANQLGVLKQVFLMTMPDKTIQPVINPQIIKASKKMLSQLPSDRQFLEGCLSFPGYFGFVDRPYKIKVRYQTEKGLVKVKTLTAPYASYFQHECNHLDGILFIDYLKKSGGQLYLADKSGKLKPVKNPFTY